MPKTLFSGQKWIALDENNQLCAMLVATYEEVMAIHRATRWQIFDAAANPKLEATAQYWLLGTTVAKPETTTK
jgi:hypothetical protein